MNGYALQPVPPMARMIQAITGREMRGHEIVGLMREVDLTEVERQRRAARAAGNPAPSYTAFIVEAAAFTLREHPFANRRLARRWWWPFGVRYQQFQDRDVAVGIERDEPGAECVAFIDVVPQADRLTPGAITERLRAFSRPRLEENRKWRDFRALGTHAPGSVAARIIGLPHCMPGLWKSWRGGAVLVSSPSKYGADCVVGSWPYPIGISFGQVKPRAVVRGGRVEAAVTMCLTFSFDRRLMAGAPAARYFAAMVDRLEHPPTERCEDEAAAQQHQVLEQTQVLEAPA